MGDAGGEAFRVRRIGRGEYDRPRNDALLRQAAMHVGSPSAGRAEMMVFGVVLEFAEKRIAGNPDYLQVRHALGGMLKELRGR